jgi:hypothetical protein
MLIGRGNVAAGPLIRSHRQHHPTTCNLSRVGPHPRIQVRGRSWSPVAVDVPIDVGQGIFFRWLWSAVDPLAKHLILRSGASLDQAPQGVVGSQILQAGTVGISSTWRQSDHTTARGQPSTQLVPASSGSAPGLSCGSPQGGRGDAPSRPLGLGHSSARGQPSRRPARLARAPPP